MKSVLVRWQEYLSQASEAEKGVINYLLKEPEAVSTFSIHEFAQAAFTSSSTIIRLCKKTGFQGYKEFHKALLYELGVRKVTENEKMREISREDSLEEIVNKVTYKNIVSLENTRKLVDLEKLQNCVNLLKKCRVIHLFGMGSSLLVAKDANLKFLRINKSCYINDDWHAQLLQAKNMTKADVAIIISYSGLTEEMLRCAEAIKKVLAPIIAITRFENTPLSALADYSLWIAATEFIFRSGAMSSRISQLNIIDILYTAYVNGQYEESLDQFKKTNIEKPYN